MSIWHYVVSVKITLKILSIFVAFLENTNFTSESHFHILLKNLQNYFSYIQLVSFRLAASIFKCLN